MGIIYGLAVILFFEGITMQSDDSPKGTTSSAEQLEAPLMPRVIINLDRLYPETGIHEDDNGQLVQVFGNMQDMVSFFESHGDKVEIIDLNYDNNWPNEQLRTEIYRNIIRKYADHFRKLRIDNYFGNGTGVWEEIDGGLEITFPNVETFQYDDDIICSQMKFNLSSIFPNLKSVKLCGTFPDEDCLASVIKLKELSLLTSSIPNSKLITIFENNKELEKLVLNEMKTQDMMKSIAETLTKLESVEFIYPTKEFLFGSGSQKYTFPLLKNLSIVFERMNDIAGEPSFSMPELKRLKLEVKDISNGLSQDVFDRIHIIGHSQKLEIIEFIMTTPKRVQSIRKIFQKRDWFVSCVHQDEWDRTTMTFQRKL